MLSGPQADECLRLLMICFVWMNLKGAYIVWLDGEKCPASDDLSVVFVGF